MTVQLPDPKQVAQTDADVVRGNHEYHFERGLERVFADARFVDRDSLLAGLDAFHKERMAKSPSPADYPESGPWVDHVLAVNRELQKILNLTDSQLAMKQSMGDYLRFRGFVNARPAADEHCRVAYVPESDHKQIHIKNVDDPITHFKRSGPPTSMDWDEARVVVDGVGSGLHIDDEPDEIFPLPVLAMVRHYADDVPGWVQFLSRYSKFWGGANEVIHDWKGNSVAVEKCSYNFIEVFEPDQYGRSHCSGMTCRDSESPQGRYQAEKRLQYVKQFNQPEDGSDMTFWAACRKFESMLANGLIDMGKNARLDDLIALFTGQWPNGLNKAGLKLHPDQGLTGYTLITHVYLHEEKRMLRWQRNPDDGSWPTEREEYQF